jgi:hypothetical protein
MLDPRCADRRAAKAGRVMWFAKTACTRAFQQYFRVVSLDAKVADMNEPNLDLLFENLTLAWETALNEKRPRDVIVSGILGYLLFRDKGNLPREHASLLTVRQAIDDLLAETLPDEAADRSEPVCSFCGRGQSEVRLAAGAHGFICDRCVSQLGEVFKEEEHPQS